MNSAALPRRPKVLVPITHPVGGIQTWCKYHYPHPRFRDFDIELMVPRSAAAAQLQESLRLPAVSVRQTGGSTQAFAAGIWRSIATGGWDLIHAHGFTAAVMCAPIAKVLGRKLLVTQHDVVLDSQYTDLRGRMIRAGIRGALPLATCIHSVSESAARNLRRLLGRRAARLRVVVVQNGIDAGQFADAARADVRAEFSLQPEDFVIGFFGRFMKQKGFSILVEALRGLLAREPCAGRRPVVLAVGSAGYRAREEREIHAAGLANNVRFTDFRADIAGLIKGVDLVAVPSLWEACGVIAMEVLTCGTPLVCSDCEGLAEVTAGTPAMRVPVGDSAALADAIALHMREDHRPAARQYAPLAAQRYSAQSSADKMAALYDQIISRERH
jgi:glycosyltransferase involved in cell wall biosynthesis